MKIGIITHNYTNNFGMFLSEWALCEKLKDLFPDYDVYMINLSFKKRINKNSIFKTCRNIGGFTGLKAAIRLKMIYKKERKKYMNFTKRVRNINQINKMGFDHIIICGDEVEKYFESKIFNSLKSVASLRCRRLVAYDAEIEHNFGYNIPDVFKRGLMNFSAISVCDKNTRGICERAVGISPVIVLDSVFLMPIPEKENEKLKDLTSEPYILFHFRDRMPIKLEKDIINAAKKKGFRVIGIGERGKPYSEISMGITPFEWAYLFKHASYIFTGTFYGVVFSILNRKNFKTYLTESEDFEKVNNFLSLLNIKKRSLNRGSSFFDPNIDYDSVYKKIDEMKNVSIRYLEETLKQ